jgi:hypothetical protein
MTNLKRVARASMLAGALAALALPALAQPSAMAQDGRPRLDGAGGSIFKCEDSSDLVARFDSRGAQFVAIVDTGDGRPVVLPLRPYTGGPVEITWSDGQRTLTWSPGVKIMWMDGAIHRSCGRDGGHRH